MLNNFNIIFYILSFITGGTSFFTLYKYYVRRKDLKAINEHNRLINQINSLIATNQRYSKSIDDLNDKNFNLQLTMSNMREEHSKRYHELEKEKINTEVMLKLLAATGEKAPHPNWKKSVNGRMIVVNEEYTKWTGITNDEYKDKTDEEVHKEKGIDYWKHDLELINSNHNYYVDINNEVNGWVIIKKKVFVGNTLVLIEGSAFKLPTDLTYKGKIYV